MKRSTRRILTTHVGSLPRPKQLLDLMQAKDTGERFESAVSSAVRDVVRKQVESGLDVVTDGEQGKLGFFAYITERLAGFEPRPGPRGGFEAEVAAFPEYYKQ